MSFNATATAAMLVPCTQNCCLGKRSRCCIQRPDCDLTHLNPEIFWVFHYSHVNRPACQTLDALASVRTRGCVWELWLGLLVDKWERVVYDIAGSGVNREAQRQDSEFARNPRTPRVDTNT
jgi:hypothetical protein